MLQKRPPKRNGPIPQVRRLHGLLRSPPLSLFFVSTSVHDCAWLIVHTHVPVLCQVLPCLHERIVTAALPGSSVLWMLLNLLAACGRWELGWLSGTPVSFCRRETSLLIRGMYTIKRVSAAGRLNSVCSHQVHLFQRWEPARVLRQVIAIGLCCDSASNYHALHVIQTCIASHMAV